MRKNNSTVFDNVLIFSYFFDNKKAVIAQKI